ncbi:MAG: hypothetical protein ABL926_12955 [Novosphingobium sp.]|uniref:hypothetical protein n=1 Tax=Novosphingobium sp. TaxID=1874826 RepID=UPI0032B7E3FC
MDPINAGKVPTSYWVVTGLGLLWNSFGAYDYVMTRMRNADYLKSAGDPQAILAWIDSFPIWAQIGWGLGVWGSFLGSVLMVLRSRHAASAFLVSLLGAIVSFGYQFTHTPPAALDTTAGKVIPLVIMAVVAVLWRYCRKSAQQGLLR